MYGQIVSILNVVIMIVIVFLVFRSAYSVGPSGPKSIGELLDALLTNHTAIVSISKIDETSISVSIVADWTGYAEQCFFNETLEGALSMAIEHKAKAEKRKAGE